MNERVTRPGLIVLCIALGAGVVNGAAPVRKGETMTARGRFDVKVTPRPQDDAGGGPFGRLFLDKQFHGDLEAASRGQMLAAETPVKQSGAYVAFELVTGVLHSKRGSFILQHKGTMRQGAYQMEVTVVPDSGTDQLKGISGTMTIRIESREHFYEFEYVLDER